MMRATWALVGKHRDCAGEKTFSVGMMAARRYTLMQILRNTHRTMELKRIALSLVNMMALSMAEGKHRVSNSCSFPVK
eukprot:1497731-Pyramimonas_sp.AAC.1